VIRALRTQVNRNVASDRLLGFYREMVEEYARHYPEKKDSWKNMSVKDLGFLLNQAYFDFWNNESLDKDQLVDIANLCAMLYYRIEAKEAAQDG